jgi:hypothetical protein
MSIVKPQTTEASEPSDPNKQDRYHAFQSLLDGIALLFVREPAGEVYSVVVAHASSGHCPYDQRNSTELLLRGRYGSRPCRFATGTVIRDGRGE